MLFFVDVGRFFVVVVVVAFVDTCVIVRVTRFDCEKTAQWPTKIAQPILYQIYIIDNLFGGKNVAQTKKHLHKWRKFAQPILYQIYIIDNLFGGKKVAQIDKKLSEVNNDPMAKIRPIWSPWLLSFAAMYSASILESAVYIHFDHRNPKPRSKIRPKD
jgi:hypothetical protein